MKNKIEIWDGICGMGKTTKAVDLIKAITGNKKVFTKKCSKVIFATPYRSECFRMADIMHSGKTPFKESNSNLLKYKKVKKFNFKFYTTIENEEDGNKLNPVEKFKKHIKDNKNLVITHSVLEKLDDEAIELAKEHNYHLIIDEAPPVIKKADLKPELTEEEFKSLQNINVIKVDDGKLKPVTWIADKFNIDLPRYSDLKNELITGKCFYLYHGKQGEVIIKLMNPNIFIKFHSVTVLTYLFEGTLLNPYLKLNNIDITIKDLTSEGYLTNSRIKDYDTLINLYEPRGLTGSIFMDENALSSSWYDKKAKELNLKKDNDGIYKPKLGASDFSELSKKTRSFFKKKVELSKEEISYYKEQIEEYKITQPEYAAELKDIIQPKSTTISDRLWTTFKPYKKLISNLNSANYNEDNFVVLNMKATNLHSHSSQLAYLVNIYLHVDIANFIKNAGVDFDGDKYSTSELIQWVFRSSIRNGNNISLFIASARMRKLFKTWIKNYEQLRYDEMDKKIPHIVENL